VFRPPRAVGLDALAFGDRGRLLAVAVFRSESAKSSIDVADAQTGKRLHAFPAPQTDWSFGTASARLAERQGETIVVWDARSGRQLGVLPISFGGVISLSADGSTLVNVTVTPANPEKSEYLATIDVWDVDGIHEEGRECRANVGAPFTGDFHMPPDAPAVVRTVIDPTRATVTTMLSGGTRGVIARCDVTTGNAVVTTVQPDTSPRAPVAAFSTDGRTVATRDTVDGAVRLFDASTGEQARAPVRVAPLTPFEFVGVTFSPRGDLFAGPSSAVNEVKVWRIHNPRGVIEHSLTVPRGATLTAIGPGGRLILIRTAAGRVEVVDRTTGKTRFRLPGAQDACRLSFQPRVVIFSDALVGTAPPGGDCTTFDVTIWNLRTGTHRVMRLPRRACTAGFDSMALTRDGHTLVVGCSPVPFPTGSQRAKRTVARLDVSGERPRVLSVDPAALVPDGLTVSPDGRAVVAAEFDRAGSGVQLMTLSGSHLRGGPVHLADGSGVGGVAFAADSRTFATGFGDGRVQLWRISGHVAHATELTTVPVSISAVAFAPDGSTLAVSDNGGGVRIWDVSTRALLGTATDQPQPVTEITFSPDGRRLIAASEAPYVTDSLGSITAVTLEVGAWQRDACLITSRNLTRLEWAQHVSGFSYETTCPSSH